MNGAFFYFYVFLGNSKEAITDKIRTLPTTPKEIGVGT